MKKIVLLPLFLVLVFTLSAQEYNWKASWISNEHNTSETNTWIIYHKNASLTNVPSEVIANIAADSKYWLFINGELAVFEGGLKRGPSPNNGYYDDVNITKYLKQGDNSIAVLVCFFGKDGFSHQSSGRGALLFDCQADGLEIISDDTWRSETYQAYQTMHGIKPNYRLSESNIRFDASHEIMGWWKSDFDDSKLSTSFAICKAGEAPFNKLVKRPIPLFKDYGYSNYVSTSQRGDTLVCKLPYNCHITPYIKLEATKGKSVEILTDHFSVGGTECVRAEYITADGVREYESLGWMNGHYVYYIIPDGVKVLDVKYRESGYDSEFAGSFNCNDEFYNTLWQKSARTLYVTMRDTYMDCPDRERAQWWGDEVNELGEAFYALDTKGQKLALKGIYELIEWQRNDGVLFSPIPAGNWWRELPMQILASVGYYGFYTQYYFSGDSTFVPVIYDRLKLYLHDVWKTDSEGFPIFREGEWSWGDWGGNIDDYTLTTCWYVLALKGELEFAKMLGKDNDVVMIEAMIKRISDKFNAKYWNGKEYRSANYNGTTDDRAQAMAVIAGLAPKEYYGQLIETIKREHHASPYMEKYVLEALCLMGDADYALERMKLRYSDMVNDECTTLWEGWQKESGSYNHAWTGGPLTILSQYICGIAPTSPGFKTFKIEPMMGSLTAVSAVVETVNGTISCKIEKQRSKIDLNITIPEGTSAKIVMPKGYKIGSIQNCNGKIPSQNTVLQSGKYLIKGIKL